MSITLCEKDHTYLFRSGDTVRRVVSVTEILDRNKFYGDGLAAERGKRIHKEIEKGTACEECSQEIRPWMEAYWDWVIDWQVVPIITETVVYSQKYDYAGKFDMIAQTRHGVFLIDFKTGAVPLWASFQTAAYVNAFEESFPQQRLILKGLRPQRLVLQLKPLQYKVKIHQAYETDLAAFLRARKEYVA